MPYSAEISRDNPTCFIILVDQSRSMEKPFGGGSEQTKADGVADAVNRLLQESVRRNALGERILDRCYVGVIGYGVAVGSGFGGELRGRRLVPVSEIGNHPLRIEERVKKEPDGASPSLWLRVIRYFLTWIEQRVKKEPDGAGGVVLQRVKFHVWFDAVAKGKTPMCEALRQAREAVAEFVGRFPRCFPPIVINITDGEATDGDPEPEAAALRGVCSEDGDVLLFNIHLSERNEKPIEYPSSLESLPDKYAQRLFRMSSEVPPVMRGQAEGMGILLRDGARGFVFNGDLVAVVQMLDIGTQVDRSMR